MKMAGTLLAHRRGILAWYDCHISTGKVEGINGENGAFPPTRDGCIHSLSMRERG